MTDFLMFLVMLACFVVAVLALLYLCKTKKGRPK